MNEEAMIPKSYHDKVCEEMARRHQAEILELTKDRPQGEWIFDPEILCSDIDVYSAGYRCSVCGKDYFKVDRMNYCPNCGARMKGADDESV